MRMKALFATTCCTVLLGGATAWADDTAARSATLYEKGNALFDEQKWAEAEAAYQAAWDLRKSFDLAGNLGESEMQIGQHRDAAEHFAYALREFPAGGKPEVRAALTTRFEEARREVGAVKVTTSIEGAKVIIDGKTVGPAPLPEAVFVEAGTRVIEAKLPGYDDAMRTVTVGKGATQEVNLVLAPKAGGGLGPRSVPLIAVGAGLGAVGIGAGIGLILTAQGQKSEAETFRDDKVPKAQCNPQHPDYVANQSNCEELMNKLKKKDLFQNVGTGALIAGGVIAVGTVIYAVLPRKKSTTVGLEVLPAVTPTFAGFSATGQF